MSEVNSINSTTYELCRYFTPSSITASQTSKTKGARARKRSMRQPLTYRNLLERQEQKVQFESLNSQTAANRSTALRKFMEANFVHIDDIVGREMRTDYPAALERFFNKLIEEGKTARSISNTKSALRLWKEAVVAHDTIEAENAGKATPFVECLADLLKTQNVALVARQSGVPEDMLRGWLSGKKPRGSNTKYIIRLEVFFGLSKHALVQLSGAKLPGVRVADEGLETKPIQFRNVLGELTRVVFCIKPAADSPLRTQWADFLAYKTAPTLTGGRKQQMKRSRRGKWRISPCPLLLPSDANWWSFLPSKNGMPGGTLKEVASARIAAAKVSAYLGWLRLDTDSGGVGLQTTQVETLAWLAHPGYIEAYLDWSKARVGARNQGATQFLAFIASLVRAETGYLRQSPELALTLPPAHRGDSWDELCDATFEITQDLTTAYDEEMQVSRDSFEPIMHILQLPQPMDAIADMVQRMRAERPVANRRAEAIWSRDIVLIKLLASNPLRLRNLAHLTWRSDNTGELHQREDKSWWLKIHKSKFKNVRGAAGDREFYESKVHYSAWKDIENYLTIHRQTLLRSSSDLFFLTAKGGPPARNNETKPVPWIDLGKRVKELTARYLYRCRGVGCHSFRHIVATAILKASGGDFKTAALVLYDRVATVEKHYAFLTANEGGERMSELMADSFNRM